MQFKTLKVAALATMMFVSSTANAAFNILWWDSTPDYGTQAPNALRKEMSDYLTAFGGGSVFSSTYVGSEIAGTLATQLASNTYDVIVFDATSSGAKFNAADIAAITAFYSAGKNNLLLDGNLYVRSIDFNASSDFPGINGSTGGLTVNEVYALASRGGGLMIGTDHDCCQTDANQALRAVLPGAGFSGNVNPSTDGQFNGTELLSVQVAVAPSDLLAHYASIPSQGIAPTGAFIDVLGKNVILYSQLDIAGTIGGRKNSFISTSFAPGGGSVVITNPNPGGGGTGAVPESATWMMVIVGFGSAGIALRRRQSVRLQLV